MIQELILALKGDNVKTFFFILSAISFHILGPKLDIVSVHKCVANMFVIAKV